MVGAQDVAVPFVAVHDDELLEADFSIMAIYTDTRPSNDV